MASRSSKVLLAVALLAALAVAASAGPAPKKVFRHYFFYKGAPATATTIRVNLFNAWNKVAPKGQKVLYYVNSWSDVGDDDLAKYPYNWGGYFDFADRKAWKAYDTWQKTQKSYAALAAVKDVVRFHAYV